MLDAATRAQVIEKCIAHLRDSYVFPEVGAAMHDAVRQRREKGEYDAIESPAVLAAKLTKDFQEVSRDKHLRVVHSNATPDNAGAADSGRQRLAHEGRNNNFGFARVDRLAGNVGYIDLRSFSPASLAADAAAMAMNAVADADALIIDVRQNGGGDGDMVALLISYLVDGELVHVNDFVGRDGSVLHESWTRKDVAGRRFTGKDVYVLTSSYTFSAAEEFAYDLVNLKRAKLVGETTGGGANPVTFFELGDRFRISVPTARARNPITQTNWEGVGVHPDLVVPARLALQAAHLEALQKLASHKPLEAEIADVRRELEALKRSGAN